MPKQAGPGCSEERLHGLRYELRLVELKWRRAMATYTVHAAKTNLSKLIERAEKGEVVVIARGKKPVVRLIPEGRARPCAAPQRVRRPQGQAEASRFLLLRGFGRGRVEALGRARGLMGALLDTHALIWWVEGDVRFHAKLRRRVGHPVATP